MQSQLVAASVTDHASHEDGLGVAEDRRAEETRVDVSDMLEVPRQGGWLGGEDERERDGIRKKIVMLVNMERLLGLVSNSSSP